MDATTTLIVPRLLLALALLLVVAFGVGVAMAVKPALLDRLRGVSDQRLSFRRATRPLNIPRNVDRWFYRHHRLYGAVVIALAIFLVYFLAFGYDAPDWTAAFGGDAEIVAETAVGLAQILHLTVGVVALIVGTIVFVRPSALKGVERWANRWLTPRRFTRGLDREHYHADAWVARHPRAAGAVIAAAAALVLLALLTRWGAIVRSLA